MFPIGIKFRLVLFAVTALTILCLSIMPNPPVPQTGILSWDKVQHALAYAALATVAGWALLPLVTPPVRAWRFALFFILGYGVLMEILQVYLTSERRGEVGDMVANALGGLLIYGVVRLIYGQLLSKYRRNG